METTLHQQASNTLTNELQPHQSSLLVLARYPTAKAQIVHPILCCVLSPLLNQLPALTYLWSFLTVLCGPLYHFSPWNAHRTILRVLHSCDATPFSADCWKKATVGFGEKYSDYQSLPLFWPTPLWNNFVFSLEMFVALRFLSMDYMQKLRGNKKMATLNALFVRNICMGWLQIF